MSVDDWNPADAPFLCFDMCEENEWRDLLCPKCKCDKIKCENGRPDLGNDARCYECGFEFVITSNCWILNQEMSDL